MTKDEASCYLYRYHELAAKFGTNSTGSIEKAITHWKEYGQKEKRDKTCEKDLTEDEASCYLNRYADVKSLETSVASPANLTKAIQNHWKLKGKTEGRNKHCAPRLTK
jgi:hypothetical protein